MSWSAPFQTPVIAGANVISLPSRLPTLAEVFPEPELVNEAEQVPTRYGLIMKRKPGHPSYCKSIGDGCGGPDERTTRAWAAFTKLPRPVFEAIARGIVQHDCKSLPQAARVQAFEFVVLLLTSGIPLLRAVAVEWNGLTFQKCWPWCDL